MTKEEKYIYGYFNGNLLIKIVRSGTGFPT